ncbi:MAG: NUDIX hydrolase [Candidatus Omnitrophota bacterium]
MKIKGIVKELEARIKDPAKGLPEEVFLFMSRITPLVNVDLLIKNKRKQTLLTWRDDGYFPAGWHIPGGIVRYKEPIARRIKAVAAAELGAKVRCSATPLLIREVVIPALRNRAHAISFLYECSLASLPAKGLMYAGGCPKQGQWAWHEKCPKDLISVHRMYRRFI